MVVLLSNPKRSGGDSQVRTLRKGDISAFTSGRKRANRFVRNVAIARPQHTLVGKIDFQSRQMVPTTSDIFLRVYYDICNLYKLASVTMTGEVKNKTVDKLPSCVNSRSFYFRMARDDSHSFWIMASSTWLDSTACYRFPAPTVLCILHLHKRLGSRWQRTRLGCLPRTSKVPPPLKWL